MVRSVLVGVYALVFRGVVRVLCWSLCLVMCVLACFLVELDCSCFLQVGDDWLMGVSVCEVW